jgi:citrate synthase
MYVAAGTDTVGLMADEVRRGTADSGGSAAPQGNSGGAAVREAGEEPHDGPGERISTREAARRLGVKPETLYAYVSRGLLGSRRTAGGRGSTFDPAEVAVLARRGRPSATRPAPRGGAEPGAGGGSLVAVRTAITLIEPDGCFFRGVDAVELARAYSFEEVAEWLWTGVLRPGTRFTAPPEALAAARTASAALPARCGLVDRLRAAVIAVAAADPLRFDLSPQAVLTTARALIPTLADALPAATGTPAAGTPRADGGPVGGSGGGPAAGGSGSGPAEGSAEDGGTEEGGTDGGTGTGPAEGSAEDGGGLARRLWGRLTAMPAGAAEVRVLDAALALLVDHGLAASTLAARVAASARAHPYAVVSAGLGALDGPLHGQASALVHRMVADVLERGDAGPVVAEHLRAGRPIPGLGHRLYRGEDPRARLLLSLLEDVPAAAPALAAAREVARTTARQGAPGPNVDLALGVLSVSCGMPPEAGETVFAVARTAGWIAHALEEYAEPPLRMRLTGTYTGPAPARPLPR